MADENGKSDLKKRLGRRRLRTASKKGLETQGTPESQDQPRLPPQRILSGVLGIPSSIMGKMVPR